MPFKASDSFFDMYQKKARFSSPDIKNIGCKKFRYNLNFTTDRKRWHNKPLYHKGLLSNLDKDSLTVIGLFQMAVTVLTAGVGLLFFPPLIVAKIVAICVAIGAFFLGTAYMISNKKINTEFFTGWSCHKSRFLLDFLIPPNEIKSVSKKNIFAKNKLCYKQVRYFAPRRLPYNQEHVSLPKFSNTKDGESL